MASSIALSSSRLNSGSDNSPASCFARASLRKRGRNFLHLSGPPATVLDNASDRITCELFPIDCRIGFFKRSEDPLISVVVHSSHCTFQQQSFKTFYYDAAHNAALQM